MNDLAAPPARQTLRALEGIANRIDAARRLLQCTRWMQEDDHRPITDMAVRRLGLQVEAIKGAERRRTGDPWAVSEDLRRDIEAALPGESLSTLSADWVLDNYAACHLSSLMSAVGVIEAVYLEDDDSRPNRMVGEALFECLHWIETERLALIDLLG